MSSWRDQILKEFTPKVARLTLVADPDGLLLEEGILEGIRERGFELIPFEDHIAFRYAYESKFRRGWYVCGDRASVDPDGYFWFVGRDDDVINTGGHLVGPFEIESALLEHPAVAESAAVAKPDPINMEVVKAFVTLKPGYEPNADLELEIMNTILRKLSPIAMPQEISFVASLPKTRSGKIVRRVLRAQEWGEPVGDVSTLMEE